MKAKPGFNIREVCGEKIMVGEGLQNIDFTKLISINESAAYLWDNIQGREFTPDTLADLLCEEYDVDRPTALADAKKIARQWIEIGVVTP